jgi:undecaprenyl-diphosphatase
VDAFFAHLGLQQLATVGYWLVFLLVLGESLAFVGFFVPGSLIVILAGGLAAQGYYRFWPLFIVAVCAALLGNTLSYEIGKRGKSFLRRHPWLWKQVLKGEAFFEHHGSKSVFIGHFLGPVRHAVPVAAGVSGMKTWPFQRSNIPGAAIWAFVHLGLGYFFGSLWNVALLWSSRIALTVVGIAAVVLIIAWLWRWVLRHGKEMWELACSVGAAVRGALMQNPSIRAWVKRHERLLAFLRERFSTKSFFGLPTTILLATFLYTVGLLLGLIEDYLAGEPIVAADQRLANLLFAFRNPFFLHASYYITLFAEPVPALIMALLLSALLWWRKQKVFVLSVWLTLVTSETTALAGKLLFRRLRPDELVRAIAENSFSFPSGHATTVAALFGFCAYLLIRTQRSWTVKVSAFFGAVVMILLVDFSRLYLGVHYLSDVLAGDLVGLSALVFSISVTEWLLWELHRKPQLAFTDFLGAAGAQIVVVTGFFLLSPAPWVQMQAPLPTQIQTNAVLSLFQKNTLPSYTETLLGTRQEPANLIVIVPEQCLVADIAKAGWQRADDVSWHSLKQAALAVVENQGYPAAPMTPSFYDARPHDVGFEKQTAARTVRARSHARFWKTKYATPSGTLFVGTVSLDTGIKWGGITHAIAPDIDTQRRIIVQDLQKAGVVKSITAVPLVPPTLGKNFTGDEFFTDGTSELLVLTSCE